MTTHTTIHETSDERRRRQLLARYTKLGQRIAELAADLDDPFNDRLRQIVAAHQREVSRKLTNSPGSACYLERLLAYHLAAMLLLHRYIERKLNRKDRWTPEEKKALQSLYKALSSFSFGINRLSPEFGRPTFTNDRLAALLWFNLTNLTAAEAEQDAADIIRLLSTSTALADGNASTLAEVQ